MESNHQTKVLKSPIHNLLLPEILEESEPPNISYSSDVIGNNSSKHWVNLSSERFTSTVPQLKTALEENFDETEKGDFSWLLTFNGAIPILIALIGSFNNLNKNTSEDKKIALGLFSLSIFSAVISLLIAVFKYKKTLEKINRKDKKIKIKDTINEVLGR